MSLPLGPRRIRRRPQPPATEIVGLSIKGLFGKLSYPHIPVNADRAASGRVSVLYGDNGTGKSTILRLLYACLSPQPNAGLRTLIARTPFDEFVIHFTDNRYLKIEKENANGSYVVSVSIFGKLEIFDVLAGPDGRIRDQESVQRLERLLRNLNLDILFVDHNRVVQSTYTFLADSAASEEQVAYDMEVNEYIYFSRQAARRAAGKMKETDLQFPIKQVVDVLERGIRAQAFRQGAVGDQSASAVYLEIAKSITRDRRKSASAQIAEVYDVVSTLTNLKSETTSFINHGLLSNYPFDNLISLYEGASRVKKQQIQTVLNPFLDSIQRRIRALDEVHRLITALESEIRKYLSGKTVTLHILEGLTISDNAGPLDLESLSSGEKQLIFLLCSAAVARNKRSIILIDEPELSLNYKWQRMIAGSLAKISSGGETQYILASHSIEIITRYVGASFELTNVND